MVYIKTSSILAIILSALWIITPAIMCFISKIPQISKEELTQENKEYIIEIAKRTWQYFKQYLTKENNYLIPDNFQEDRKEKVVDRTSSTNIGLSLLAVIASYDLKFSNLKDTLEMLKNIINTIDSLEKWEGHLYNWYNIKSKKPLIPRYVSTVDSGNLVGYLYTTKSFLEEIQQNQGENLNEEIEKIENIINNTNFKVLYNKEQMLFSIGFNIEDNKLTDSYYDLLASEARQASLVAIAKKDVPAKHWNSLSRTLTVLKKYKGLISWSGTAFEYLMPNINIPRYEGSLLDEASKFLIMNQIEYSKRIGVPWGISESAFNLKDLHSNYQYKAFGIPWLGLKRGLAEEKVVSSYGSILAITDEPQKVVENLKELEKMGMFQKYGFYESIDFTPERLPKGKKYVPVKTYMAHHQGLILLSIDNLFNNNIFQKRFMKNPEIEAVSILLQERMPETFIITKENKIKPEKIKYKDYENYSERVYTKLDEKIVNSNVIGNENYIVAIDQKGRGFSEYDNMLINRFKKTDDYEQGIFFYIKDVKNNKIWSAANTKKSEKYSINFSPNESQFEQINSDIKTKLKITVANQEPVEIRKLEIQNNSNEERTFEITTYFEPVLSKKEQDYAHQAFNNLFLVYEYDENLDCLVVKRKKRGKTEKEMYLATKLQTNCEKIGDTEYEIDKEKFIGRTNFGIPMKIKDSSKLSKTIGLTTEGIVALKNTIIIKPGEKASVNLILSANYDKQKALQNIEKYNITQNIDREFEISKAKTETECRYLEIKGKEIEIYQKILSYILFENPLKSKYLEKLPNINYNIQDLWKYGISGDLPLIVVSIKYENDIYVVKQILKAYEFFRTKNIKTELVIINEEKYSYESYIKDEIENCILNSQLAYLKNIYGGIFVLQKNEMAKQDLYLIKLTASLIIDSHLGNLENVIKDMEEEYLENKKIPEVDDIQTIENKESNEDFDILENTQNLKYDNEYGAFSEDGKEYLIRINQENKIPTVWSNILVNNKFGSVVTENLGGYTWYKNSRLNRTTCWNNSANLDMPSEIIYLKDIENNKTWTLNASVRPDNKNYNIIYGFGYAKYIHLSDEIMQELEVFVPREESAKISILTLRNNAPKKKKIKIIYYIKPVLGEDEIKTNNYIKAEKDNNIVHAKNMYSQEGFENILYVTSSENINSYTGDKKFFIGETGLKNPQGIQYVRLNNDSGLGKESCIAVEIETEIESFSNKQISIILGVEEKILDVKNVAFKYSNIQNCNIELEQTKKYWRELLSRIQVQTPYESLNIMLNGWAMYQTIASRMKGRSGFYQSGGAYGFRDQLQDSFGTKFLDSKILKEQIIKHSKHQFIEGDVEHWWHEETSRGIRTRFSDDLLWLVYATIIYIDFTGDYSILDEETSYLNGRILSDEEEERYDKYEASDIKETIYEHCKKAIEKSINFGKNGLPKIGIGDWNDGFSNVGAKGIGESVWLGFFLYEILNKFVSISKIKEDFKSAERYLKIADELKLALNENAWDGKWYKRAFTDDGKVLGSHKNEECKIDSIAQSWSVISGAGDGEKKNVAMESLQQYLVDKENKIIKLLDPPFEKSDIEPGYIKSYVPGVRENGGQYTHAAIWAIIAEAILEKNEKAVELYQLINPIEHSKNKELAKKYKVEPYVIPADIYGAQNLIGQGGWTWYTGSSSWYYLAGIEYILGIKIKNNILKIKPCIPSNWKEYSVHLKWGESIYNIKVNNKRK